jgi:GNAT superfamily N-acetyltransferase
VETIAEQRSSITFQQHPEDTLYLAWEYDEQAGKSRLMAFLKVGRKHLFLYDKRMQPYEGTFICLLDFYVHYAHQRKGIGTALFKFMMESERVEEPCEVPLDNPSVTLLQFLSKKFGLDDPVWQNTNYVVFPKLFTEGGRNDECNERR